MADMHSLLPMLAENGNPQQGGLETLLVWMPFILIFVVFWFIIVMPQRQERRRREEMLGSLKKNDRVVTIGGIYGTIANFSPDGQEVTLKVDDNMRIKFRRDAIQQVIREDEGESTA